MKYVPNYPDMDNLFPYPKIPNIDPPKYEERKTPYELLESQSAYLEKTSKELHQSDIAMKTSNKAITCAFMEFAVHHSEITEFVKTLVK